MYTLTASPNGVLRDADGAYIPNDAANADWHAYQAWLGQGNTASPYVAPPAPVPASTSRRQMILGLVQAGYITSAEGIAAAQSGAVPAAVQSVFDTLPDQATKDAAAITWASMSECQRSNGLVAALAAAHSLSSSQVDDLFRAWALL